MKKNNWLGLLILIPILLFLGIHYNSFLGKTMYNFPHHLLSTLFCIITMFIYPIFIFENKKIKITGTIISLIIIIVMTIILFVNKTTYKTTILTNGGSVGAVFDDSYKVYLEDDKLGDVYIKDDIWVDMITKEVVTWLEMAQKLNENGITQMQLDWSKVYGELSPGTYRVVKYNGLSTLYSEPFTIEE